MNWRFLLWPLGLIFMFVVWLRGLFYRWGLLTSKRLDSPVIGLGNLTTGGTGKTPWVQEIAAFLATKDCDVTILSRGYSGDFDGVLQVTPDMDPRRCGDEPLWLVQNTEARVFVGRSRWQAGRHAASLAKVGVFLLDDGFQHQQLHRDLDIVLLDASAPKHHYWPLPVGYLREGFLHLARAQVVIINKCNYGDPETQIWLESQCRRYLSEDSIFFADYQFSQWSPLIEGLSWNEPGDKKAMTCGVGNPRAFLQTLQEQGVEPVRRFVFPDHYYWKPDDIERMTYHMQKESCRDLMITEKDAVKLYRYRKHFLEMQIQLWVCEMRIELHEREDDFFQKIARVVL
jgi:tetraacyldisaccharide 4'-kinase